MTSTSVPRGRWSRRLLAALGTLAISVAAATLVGPATQAAAECPSIPPDADPNVLRAVYQATLDRGASDKVTLATFEAGWVESRMNNLPCGDLDSIGVFQQRDSWGTREQRLDVRWATNKFLDVAFAKDNPSLAAHELAQAVQVSCCPDRYRQAESTARELIRQAQMLVTPPPPPPSERKGGSGGLAASWGVGRLDVFGRGGGGSVYHNYHDRGGQSWPGWGALPGSGGSRSRPVTVSWGSGRLDVFAVGADQKMKHWWFDRAGDNRWRGPETLGDTTFTGTPTVVTYDPGRIDVFARDTNNQLRHNYVISGGTAWPGWEILGSDLGGDPAVVSWHAARWDVFAIGTDRRMKHWWFDRLGESRWRGPEVIGTGTFAGTPAAVSWEPGRIDLFARDEAGRLRHNYVQSGVVTWPAWENWGGDITSSPVAVTWEFGRLDVFAVGADQRMKHWWFDRAGDNSWRGPEGLADTTFSNVISAVAWAPGRLDVFGIDTNNTMRHNGFERGVTGWTGWQHLGGTFQP